MYRTSLRMLRKLSNRVNRTFCISLIRMSESNNTKSDDLTNEGSKNIERVLPPEPTYCCNSGCANCVWIKYAQEVTQLFDDGDIIAKNKISEKVQDPKLKAFLFTQLGLKENDKES